MTEKLGREVIRLVEGGELDHPGLLRGVERIREHLKLLEQYERRGRACHGPGQRRPRDLEVPAEALKPQRETLRALRVQLAAFEPRCVLRVQRGGQAARIGDRPASRRAPALPRRPSLTAPRARSMIPSPSPPCARLAS